MRIEIKSKITNEILVTGEGKTENLAFLDAIKNAFDPSKQSANLVKADLSWANLFWANLSRANLESANLVKANLSWANLFWANLSWANLESANLKHIDARCLQLSEEKEILFRMDCCVWPITIWHNVVSIGCKDFSFEEILKMTEDTAEKIEQGAGKRWKRFGNTLKTAIKDIQDSGI